MTSCCLWLWPSIVEVAGTESLLLQLRWLLDDTTSMFKWELWAEIPRLGILLWRSRGVIARLSASLSSTISACLVSLCHWFMLSWSPASWSTYSISTSTSSLLSYTTATCCYPSASSRFERVYAVSVATTEYCYGCCWCGLLYSSSRSAGLFFVVSVPSFFRNSRAAMIEFVALPASSYNRFLCLDWSECYLLCDL